MSGTNKRAVEVAVMIVVATWLGVSSSHATARGRVPAESFTNEVRGRLATGGGHTCLAKDDGTVWCWGSNSAGQLGDGTIHYRLSPVSVGGIINIVAVTAGFEHTCALQADGHVWCWGASSLEPYSGRQVSPFLVNISNVVSIVARANYTCALIGDGTVRCWGLYPAASRQATAPTPVSGIANATALAAGAEHACVLLATGIVRCWGRNFVGQLGNGTTTDSSTPVTVTGLGSAINIAAGVRHTCALAATGAVRCWGDNSDGQLGDGTTTDALTAIPVDGLTNVSGIAAGYQFTCALTNVDLRCWGRNDDGQLGDGTTTTRLTPPALPVHLPTAPIPAAAVSASGRHTCAIIVGNSVWCWGYNYYGQLGNGTGTSSNLPTAVLIDAPQTSFGTKARQIATGSAHSCAVRANGLVACWGDNSFGQLGDGTNHTRLTPVTVSSFGLSRAVQVAAGFSHTCALVPGGLVRCWGDNGAGQLGDGTTRTRSGPGPVSGLGNVVAIAAGNAHTCALVANGTVRCWGFNTSGQIGNGAASTAVLVPTAVTGLSGVTAISAGGSHTCALRFNGTVRCWGANATGQLGDGTTTGQLTPITVSGLGNAVSIAAGDFHTCVTLANGGARCWGGNSTGALGDGTTTQRLTPVAVSFASLTPAPAFAATITAGSGHTCALLADGFPVCWGDNAFGKLGDGTTINRSTPARVLLTNSGPLATGMDHTCTVAADGVPRCWGDNAFGQIGDGTTLPRLSPKRVSSF
jgi:alpha-tubulin suppressor-like RCC1 family protein